MLQVLCKREVNITVVDSITDWNKLDTFIEDVRIMTVIKISYMFSNLYYIYTDISAL